MYPIYSNKISGLKANSLPTKPPILLITFYIFITTVLLQNTGGKLGNIPKHMLSESGNDSSYTAKKNVELIIAIPWNILRKLYIYSICISFRSKNVCF